MFSDLLYSFDEARQGQNFTVFLGSATKLMMGPMQVNERY